MKREIKGTINMKLQLGETVKLNDVLYIPQSVKNLLSVLMLVSKVSTTGATKDKINTNKNGVSMTLDARKEKKREHNVLLKG